MEDRFFGIRITPLTRRRLHNFRANRRGFWSLWIFLALFFASLFAEIVANDRPLVVYYDEGIYFPVFERYTETAFGGEFETEADYRDPYVIGLIDAKGWLVWPLIEYGPRTINYELPQPAPAPPSPENWLGTDDQGPGRRGPHRLWVSDFRPVRACAHAVQFDRRRRGPVPSKAISAAGRTYSSSASSRSGGGLPVLFLLIILSSVVEPNFWWLLGIMLLFSWMTLVGVVRAEFLRARNFDYVRAAARSWGQEPDDHVPPRASQRHGRDAYLPSFYPERVDHDAHLA